MSTIPISLTEAQFQEQVAPCLSKAKRGFVCRIPLFKVFNYTLYKLHTGCQWAQVPIERRDDEKKNSVMMRCTTTFVNGAAMAA
jgi:hypothetical protein